MKRFLLAMVLAVGLLGGALATGPQEPSHVINVPVGDTTNQLQREVNRENRRVFEGIRASVDTGDTAFNLAKAAYEGLDTVEHYREAIGDSNAANWAAFIDTVEHYREAIGDSNAANWSTFIAKGDSQWTYTRVYNAGDDSVITTGERIGIFSDSWPQMLITNTDGDSICFGLDADGLTIDANGDRVDIIGDMEIAGAVSLDGLINDGTLRVNTNSADQFTIIHTPGSDSASFQVDNIGDVEIFASGGDIDILSDLAVIGDVFLRDGGNLYIYDGTNAVWVRFYTSLTEATLFCSKPLTIYAGNDSVIIAEDLYVAGDLEVTGSINLLFSGTHVPSGDGAADTATWVSIPSIGTEDYAVTATAWGTQVMFFKQEAAYAKTDSGFWICANTADSLDWIAALK